jgi:hypothetical protein
VVHRRGNVVIRDAGPWTPAVHALLRHLEGAGFAAALHRATGSFRPPPDAEWFPWHGRDLGSAVKVFGHCDVAPWNIVARDGLPVALIDWETAGPVDPLVELDDPPPPHPRDRPHQRSIVNQNGVSAGARNRHWRRHRVDVSLVASHDGDREKGGYDA